MLQHTGLSLPVCWYILTSPICCYCLRNSKCLFCYYNFCCPASTTVEEVLWGTELVIGKMNQTCSNLWSLAVKINILQGYIPSSLLYTEYILIQRCAWQFQKIGNLNQGNIPEKVKYFFNSVVYHPQICLWERLGSEKELSSME